MFFDKTLINRNFEIFVLLFLYFFAERGAGAHQCQQHETGSQSKIYFSLCAKKI
jgi:hypothetical protein